MDPVSGMLLGGAALGGFNSLLGVGASAADAALQYHYAKKMYQHRYRWAMQDMQKAGLNPVLAANGGNVSGMSSAPSTDFAGAIQNGVNSAMQTARTVSDLEAQQVSNAKTEADTKSVNQDVVSKTIRNKYLEPQEEALVRDAQARATNNTALATLNEARSEYAKSMALAEQEAKIYRVLNLNQDQYLKGINGKMLEKSPEYTMSAAERRWLQRIKVGADALGRGVNSAVGVGKLRALFSR